MSRTFECVQVLVSGMRFYLLGLLLQVGWISIGVLGHGEASAKV